MLRGAYSIKVLEWVMVMISTNPDAKCGHVSYNLLRQYLSVPKGELRPQTALDGISGDFPFTKYAEKIKQKDMSSVNDDHSKPKVNKKKKKKPNQYHPEDYLPDNFISPNDIILRRYMKTTTDHEQ